MLACHQGADRVGKEVKTWRELLNLLSSTPFVCVHGRAHVKYAYLTAQARTMTSDLLTSTATFYSYSSLFCLKRPLGTFTSDICGIA